MNTTERHIAYLLNEKTYVEVPGLGTFTSHRMSAALEGNVLKAPYLTVSLDTEAQSCDASLAESISRQQDVDTETAGNIISADVDSILYSVKAEGSADFGDMGVLVENDEKIRFVQSPSYNLPGCHYPDLELTLLNDEGRRRKPLPGYADTDEKKEEFLRSLRRTASSAAAIAIIAVLAFVFSQLPGRHGDSRQASVVVEQTAPEQVTFVSPAMSQADPALVLVFNTPADASCEVLPEETAIETVEEEAPIAVAETEMPYCLIVASLASEQEALQFIRDTDTSLSLLAKDGRFRVYVMQGESYESLYKEAQREGIYDRYPSAWICKR